MADEVKEGLDVGEPKVDADGKYPETVNWNQYVGIKESLGKKLDTATQKVTDLEEQVKKAISADEHTKVKTELDDIKTRLQTASDELKTSKETTLTEKRNSLISKGVAEDKVKDMSVEQLDGISGALDGYKPKPDMAGGGAGSGGIGEMSPKERAAEADRRLRETNK